jgi:uncharacterized OB-fold protein
MDQMPLRPVPDVTTCSRPHWEGLTRGEFLIQQCAQCGTLRHYPRPVCGSCHSMEVTWLKACGEAHIYSWTIAHHAYHPAFKTSLPYTLVTADLPEGVRILARLENTDGRALHMSAPLRIGYERVTEAVTLPILLWK